MFNLIFNWSNSDSRAILSRLAILVPKQKNAWQWECQAYS